MDIFSMFGLNKGANKDVSDMSLEDLKKREKKLSTAVSKLEMALKKLHTQVDALQQEIQKRETEE